MTKARSKPKAGSSRARRPPLPAVDERLVMPNTVIAEEVERARAEARAQGRFDALVAMLHARGLRGTPKEESTLRSSDPETLADLLLRAVSCRSVKTLLSGAAKRSRRKRPR